MIAGKCFMQIVSVTICHQEKVKCLVSSLSQSSNVAVSKTKKYFAKLLFTQKQMMGRKKLAPLTPLLLCVANIDWAMSGLTGSHIPASPLFSHRSCLLSQRDSQYWYCTNSHTTVSAESTLSIITLFTLLYLLLSLSAARCINSRHCHSSSK